MMIKKILITVTIGMLYTTSVYAKLKTHQEIDYYREFQLKFARIQDRNALLIGGISGKHIFHNFGIGVFFFYNVLPNDNFRINNNIRIVHYEGLTVNYNYSFTKKLSYTLRILLGFGIAKTTDVGFGIVNTCTCGIGVVEPIAKLNYGISPLSSFSFELNVPSIIHSGNQITAGIGAGISYGINW